MGSQGGHRLTYIVVSILDEEGDAGALEAVGGGLGLQTVLCSGHVVEQLAICEAAAGERVDNGRGGGVVGLDGLKDGQAGQRRSHSGRSPSGDKEGG